MASRNAESWSERIGPDSKERGFATVKTRYLFITFEN